MPPFQYPNAPQAKRKSVTPPTNESNGSSSDLLFITGNKPADFRAKTVMTKVRRKAMGSYLETQKEKNPKNPTGRKSRLHSEDSTFSRTSINSEQRDAVDEIISNSEALMIFRGESRRPGRRPSSPIRSPASSCNEQRATHSPDSQIARIPQSLDILLPSAPMVRPMRSGIVLDYDATSPRPFQSIGTPLDPFRTMFQAHAPQISVEELKFYCSRSFGTRAMGQHWIPTLILSPHAFLSTLCIASAHHDAIFDRAESAGTIALRQEVMHLIGQSLVNPQSRVDDFNIAALTQLIASEIISREDMALSYHEKGIEAMIKQRGGLGQLGVKGRLASTASWVSLESAIFREAKPRSMYTEYCASTSSRSYPNTATVPESPLFCPRRERTDRGNFETVSRSDRCSTKTLDLLKDIRMMTELFLHETKHSRKNSPSLKNIYKKIITHYPSAAELQKSNVMTRNDWTYEAVRVASVLQATAILKRVPLSEALKYCGQAHAPTPFYSASNASKSSESLVSPRTLRHDSPLTGFSTPPVYATSPPFASTNPFNYIPPPSAPGAPKLSVSSAASDVSSYFPAPPVPTLTGSAALLTDLKKTIDSSDLSDCWEDMAGVLLWVGLIVGTASRTSDKKLKKWFSALVMRCSIVLCFEHPQPIHATLLRMCEMVEALGYADNSGEEVVRRGSSVVSTTESNEDTPRKDSSSKKRRF